MREKDYVTNSREPLYSILSSMKVGETILLSRAFKFRGKASSTVSSYFWMKKGYYFTALSSIMGVYVKRIEQSGSRAITKSDYKNATLKNP